MSVVFLMTGLATQLGVYVIRINFVAQKMIAQTMSTVIAMKLSAAVKVKIIMITKIVDVMKISTVVKKKETTIQRI